MSVLQRIRDRILPVIGENRDTWQEVLQRIFNDNEDEILGLYQGARDRGMAPRIARQQAAQGFFEAVAEELAASLDERLDWEAVESWELRAWLEERDGPFFEALLEGALELIAWRLSRRGRRLGRFARLLTVAVSAAPALEVDDDTDDDDEDEQPTVVRRAPGDGIRTLSKPPAVTDVVVADPPEPEEPEQPLAARVRSFLQRDRAADEVAGIRKPSDLPPAPIGLPTGPTLTPEAP